MIGPQATLRPILEINARTQNNLQKLELPKFAIPNTHYYDQLSWAKQAPVSLWHVCQTKSLF